MNFNDHSKLIGQHAFLSPSKYHWLNYDEDKLVTVYMNTLGVQRGVELHDLACRLIRLNQKLPRSQKTLNMYVNDAIGFKMTPEQPLYYSPNCFGTCDAISFRDNQLRIHDLKTGTSQAHIEQLMIYAALFCLEYKYKPDQIDIELRIYQNNEILTCVPEIEDIEMVIEKIKACDIVLNQLKEKEG